ncbi:hypothetical protein ABZP36_025524 [Zizania latifolia]
MCRDSQTIEGVSEVFINHVSYEIRWSPKGVAQKQLPRKPDNIKIAKNGRKSAKQTEQEGQEMGKVDDPEDKSKEKGNKEAESTEDAKNKKHEDIVLSSEESSEEEGKVHIPRFNDDQPDEIEELMSEVENKHKERVDIMGKAVEKHLMNSLVGGTLIPPVQCVPFSSRQLPMIWDDTVIAEDLNLAIVPVNFSETKSSTDKGDGCSINEIVNIQEENEGVAFKGDELGEFKMVKKKAK